MPDPEKRLYVVSLEVEALVYAASPEEARRLGRDGIREDIVNYGASDCSVREHVPGTALPDDWDEDCLPHGANIEETVGEILARAKRGEHA